MLVTNTDIEKDIIENMQPTVNALEASVVRDMMFYMREQYENKLSSMETEIQILNAALNAVNNTDDSGTVTVDVNTPSLFDDFDYSEITVEDIGKSFDTMIDDLVSSISTNFLEIEEVYEEPENFIYCRGRIENGEEEALCDGRESCKKYIGYRSEDEQDRLVASADFTNMDTCKALNYDLFEPREEI